MKTRIIFLISALALVSFIAACSSPTPTAPAVITVVNKQPTVAPPTQPPAAPTTAPAANFADAFAYCTAVVNVDVPDARYTGAKMPDNVLNGLILAAKVSPSMPKDVLAQQSFWRCMNSKVYACMVGANLPCQEKADTNKTPSAAVNDFCKANPSAAVIPAAVTGRATVYEWKCVSGKPEIAKELFKPDARGFLSDFWYEIAPAASMPGTGIANPASTNCIQNGGKLEIRKDAKGGEVGYCIFPDKSECEEWAFMRGECKPGAKPATPGASMANPASTYCVQNGGKLEIRKTPGGEAGYCVFADKSECEEWAFMRGECKPGNKPTNVTKADNGKTVNAAVGGTVVVTLEGNPGSTGYLWGLEAGNDGALKPQGDYKFTSTSNMPGAGGKFEFKFTAASAGAATLKFANKRPWELNDPKAETFSVTVVVK